MSSDREQVVLPILITIGERWQIRTRPAVQHQTMGQKWLLQSLQRQERYGSSRALERLHRLSRRLEKSNPHRTAELNQSQAEPSQPMVEESEMRWPSTGTIGEKSSLLAETAPLLRQPVEPLPKSLADSTLPQQPEEGKPSRDVNPARLPASIVHRSASHLTDPARRFFAQILNIRVPAVKIHVDQASDTLVRRHRADALAYGDHLLFRTDKYSPETWEGLGLLGHELTHATQSSMNRGVGGFDSHPNESDQEEATALHNELRILHHLTAPSLPNYPPVAEPTTPSLQRTVQPVAQPRAAASNRDLGQGLNDVKSSRIPLTEHQLKQIKELVYRDLMERIRAEFERGG
jgi:hypothetical protein